MDGTTRIWLDDPNPIFRMGLAASLRNSPFVVVGESAGMVPPPELAGVDVLVFDLGEQSGSWAPSRRHLRSTRLVGLVPGGDVDQTAKSQCTVLVRSELTPEGFRDCLASVAAGVSAPAASAGRPGPAEGHFVGSIRAAWSDAGGRLRPRAPVGGEVPGRLRRAVRRRGALFAVALALAAGAFGPSGRAEGLADSGDAGSGSTLEAATPVAETTPVLSDGDAAADIAVWVNPADPAASLVIGTDKRGALESYDLKGQRVQRLPRPPGTVNIVDVRTGFPLGGRTVALVGTGGRAISFFRIHPAGRPLPEGGGPGFSQPGAQGGFCLY